jgi:hypothetical protein
MAKGFTKMNGGRIVVYLFMFATTSQLFAFTNEDWALRYTLSIEQLQHAGLTRLPDIFSLIDEWDYYSLEGYTLQGVSNNRDIYQQQNWVIMVDDQKMDLKVFDVSNINLLPFNIDQIDSIEVFIYTQLEEDEFSDKGLLHIHTRQIKPGVTVQGQFTLGNEVGDPGPYRYTIFSSKNVDRIAADDSYWLSFGGDAGFLGAGYKSQTHYVTDPLIEFRNREIHPYSNPLISSHSFSFRAGLPKIISNPEFYVAHTILDDFYFFKPLGREIPVKNYYSSAGLKGSFIFGPEIDLSYKVRFTANDLKKRNNLFDIDFKWKSERFYGNVQLDLHKPTFVLKFGLGFEHLKLKSDYSLSPNIINTGKLYGSVNFNFSSSVRQKFDAMALINRDNTGIKISGTNQWKIDNRQSLCGSISYSQTPIVTENTLWYWSEKGYDFVKENGGDYYIMGRLMSAEHWSLNFSWCRKEDTFPSIESGISWDVFNRKNFEEQRFQYDPVHQTASAPIYIRTEQPGKSRRVFLRLKYSQWSSFKHHFYYGYTNASGGSLLFRNLIKANPEHRFIYRITFNPVESFSIWAMCKYISSVFWYDYRDINEQSDGIYAARLPEILLIDLAINKWVWKRRIKLDVIFRNLINEKHRSHPMGASLDLRFYVQAEIFFNF